MISQSAIMIRYDRDYPNMEKGHICPATPLNLPQQDLSHDYHNGLKGPFGLARCGGQENVCPSHFSRLLVYKNPSPFTGKAIHALQLPRLSGPSFEKRKATH